MVDSIKFVESYVRDQINEENKTKKEYIGDGVYAAVENGMIKLTTENGIAVSNTIYLEPQVLEALNRFNDSVKEI